ncbi:MAG TPA: hypothetical protein VH475_05800 [Tepidisphaeraceae bacterium]|jgi:zinc transport system substrate-binding protein
MRTTIKHLASALLVPGVIAFVTPAMSFGADDASSDHHEHHEHHEHAEHVKHDEHAKNMERQGKAPSGDEKRDAAESRHEKHVEHHEHVEHHDHAEHHDRVTDDNGK